MVIAKTGAKRIQSIIPNQREWLSMLVCVNAIGRAIPSLYIFRSERFRENYIHHCEAGATMAMQPKATSGKAVLPEGPHDTADDALAFCRRTSWENCLTLKWARCI
jgi:hypothetical protein